MATVLEYNFNITVIDSRGKFTTHTIRANAVDANAYIDAVDDAARTATDLGGYLSGFMALSAANFVSASVEKVVKDDAYSQPAADSNIYHFDKLTVGYKVGLERYITTIPSRDDSAYNVAPNAIDVLITGAGASTPTTDFVTAFQAIALDKDGEGPAVVTYMKVSS